MDKTETLSKRKVISICLLAIFWRADTSLLPSLHMKSPPECEPSTHPHLVAYKNIIPQLKINLKKNPIYIYKKRDWPATHNDLHNDTLFLYNFYCWNWNWNWSPQIADLLLSYQLITEYVMAMAKPYLLLFFSAVMKKKNPFFSQLCSSYPPIPSIPIITWWRYTFCEQRKGKCFP